MLAIGTVETNQMPQRGNTFANLFHLLAKAAVIEKPSRFGVDQEFHVGVGGIAEVDRNPGGSGAQDAQHAEQNCCVIMGVNCGPLLPLEAAGSHPAGDPLAEGAGFTVGVPSVSVEDRDSVGVEIRALIKIVDSSHG